MRLAQINGINSPATHFQGYNTLLGDVASRFLLFVVPIAGFYFLIRLITSGFTYMTSLGDPGKLASAQKQLTNALIGLVVVFSAYFIGQILAGIFGIRIF